MSKNETIYAIDFDGTLCEDAYPGIGKPIDFMIRFCKERKAAGDKLILWTCRIGPYLEDAVAWCRYHGIEFDAVNENLPHIVEKYGGDTRKLSADYYIDDRIIPMAEINVKQVLTDAGMVPGQGDLTQTLIHNLMMVEGLKYGRAD